MADSNFDRLAISIKRYIDDKTKNSSSQPIDMSQYVKKKELSTVAISGSYLDLTDLPVINGEGTITKKELDQIINTLNARIDEIQAEIDFIKEHCHCGGESDKSTKISLEYNDGGSEDHIIKGLVYQFADDSTETEADNALTLGYDDDSLEEIG